jgi:hypothetical protein
MNNNAGTTIPETLSKRYQIAPDFDLVIILKEFFPRTKHGEPDRLCRVHEFEVSKKIICEFDYFQVVGFSQSPADAGKDLYEVKDDDPVAFKTWLELLHHGTSPVSLKVGIATVWRVLGVARKYKFHVLSASAQTWFREWYNTRENGFSTYQCRELIYPCYTFNDAHLFAAVTKKLAYNIRGHIQENMPDGVSDEQEEQRLRSRATSKR